MPHIIKYVAHIKLFAAGKVFSGVLNLQPVFTDAVRISVKFCCEGM